MFLEWRRSFFPVEDAVVRVTVFTKNLQISPLNPLSTRRLHPTSVNIVVQEITPGRLEPLLL